MKTIGKLKIMRQETSFLINFHIFSLPNLFKMLYSYDSILMCMTNLSIDTFLHLNVIVPFK